MEESNNPLTSSSPNSNGEPSSSSSPSPPSHGREEEQQQQQQQPSISYRVNISIRNALSTETRDDVWSCLVILVTFWIFASMTLILGFYGSVDLLLGPNCSQLLQSNSFFVQDIKVKAGAESMSGPMLYGFSEPPPLDIRTTWFEAYNASIAANFHKEWIYYLNGGAQVNVSYNVKSQGSYPLTLVIAQGKESLSQWIEDPSHPNTTLSWNIIHGKGLIQQNIEKPSNYYVAVGNLNQLEMEVQLNFSIHALMYNTTGAYYKCSPHHGLCVLKLFFLRANAAILTTSGPRQAGENAEWYVKLSYGPRWITYFVCSGGMTIAILLAFKIFTNLQSSSGDGNNQTVASERTPLLANKDDDNSSLGSSYDSVSHEEEDVEEWFEAASKLLNEGETDSRLCAICFDAQRDCFFLPCGHCATCFTCGTRITDEAGTCPICRRRMKKVRKIFTV